MNGNCSFMDAQGFCRYVHVERFGRIVKEELGDKGVWGGVRMKKAALPCLIGIYITIDTVTEEDKSSRSHPNRYRANYRTLFPSKQYPRKHRNFCGFTLTSK